MNTESSLAQKVARALAGHPKSDLLRTEMLSPDRARAFQRALVKVPITNKKCELLVQYAEEHGGLVLEVLQLTNGPCFGTAVVLSLEKCARALDVDEAELMRIYEQASANIRPMLVASPEFQAASNSNAVITDTRDTPAACNLRCETIRSVCESVAQDQLWSSGPR